MTDEERSRLIREYVTSERTDLYIYSGGISDEFPKRFCSLVLDKKQVQPKAAAILTTGGGDIAPAFRMAKALRNRYKTIRLLIAGPCKSAGTLFALVADELAFYPTGELGPLDVQIPKPDEFMVGSSGLDVFQGLSVVTEWAFNCFEDYLLRISARSGGNITAKTAAEIATNLVSGLFQPVSAQIDPLRLGEAQRKINIAKEYGRRLSSSNVKNGTLESLVDRYPTHGFVIDQDEAKELFEKVEPLTDLETRIVFSLSPFIFSPPPRPLVLDLGQMYNDKVEDNARKMEENNGGNAKKNEPAEPRDSDKPLPRTAKEPTEGKRRDQSDTSTSARS